MLPVDHRGLAGWRRLGLFSPAVYMSNRSVSLSRLCDTALLKAVTGILDLCRFFKQEFKK